MKYADKPTPAILIAHSRSGSHFLASCLDSHNQICCERGGPFNPRNAWLNTGITPYALASALWQREGCRVSMFRITQRQFKNGYVTLDTMREFKPRVLYLYRENILKSIISAQLSTAAVKGDIEHPLHTYEPVEQRRVTLDCNGLIAKIDDYVARTEKTKELLGEFPLLNLTYEQIAEDGKMPVGVAHKICDFLGVRHAAMYSELVKLNTAPVITNLSKVESTLAGTEYEWML